MCEPARQTVVNKRKNQAGVHAPEDALGQTQQKTPEAKPGERRQNQLQEIVHVDAFRSYKAKENT